MFEEKAFQVAYQKAYDEIVPDEECIRRLVEGEERFQRNGRMTVFKPLITTMAVTIPMLCLALVVSLPALAKNIPKVYDVVAKYAPGLENYILPSQLSSTSQGITMQVEAVHVEGTSAELVLSFSDAENSPYNYIKGAVDLYDSYHLQSYGAVSNVGGCHFLEYDEAADKAYFKLDLTTNEV
ncbi:MAG: DUF4179 domain-containing protein, partial [Lachnospiraceae bacterium]|nr:DUF4179 domain-containing protein [Lachnospiraceae bacterium]